MKQFRTSVELAVREGRIGYEEAGQFLRFYEDGLQGYTYRKSPSKSRPPQLALWVPCLRSRKHAEQPVHCTSGCDATHIFFTGMLTRV
jgi:hypothetical protein